MKRHGSQEVSDCLAAVEQMAAMSLPTGSVEELSGRA